MAFLGMAQALRSLTEVVVEWWPSEGTLISLMRYGKGMEQLPGNYDVAAGGEQIWNKCMEKWSLDEFGCWFGLSLEKIEMWVGG